MATARAAATARATASGGGNTCTRGQGNGEDDDSSNGKRGDDFGYVCGYSDEGTNAAAEVQRNHFEVMFAGGAPATAPSIGVLSERRAYKTPKKSGPAVAEKQDKSGPICGRGIIGTVQQSR